MIGKYDMKNALFTILAVGISAAAAAGLADDALVLPNGRRITRSMITGHRGDARSLPENTLMAFRRAVDNGFCFECDFYMTNDGEVYCVHDMNLKRTFGIAGRATNVCWKGTLDKVDVGAIKGPPFAGRADCRVPRIDEVFALIPDDGRKITLEVKDPRPEIVPLIQAAWRRHPNMKEENIIFLAHKATRAALVKAFPRATFQHCVNCYSDGWRKGCTPIPVDRQLAELDARPECRNFSPMFDLDLLTPDYIAAVHRRGIVFYTWCVDRPEDAVEVFGRGVDGICSNCPVELWEGLKAMCATSKAGAQAMQKNGEVWYDTAGHAVNAHGGGVLAHGGKYYLYGEHKVYGRAGNKAHVGVHIYSSDDLARWTDEGIALKVEDKPGHDIEDGCVLERPKILFCDKTGKFVMFFHLELKGQGYSAARVGIAVADKVTGPYRFLRSLRPNAGQWPMNVPERERVEETKAKYMTAGGKAKLWGAHFAGGQMSRDMTLFKDDDDKAWHIFSSEDNSTLHIAELTDDYLDYTGRWWRAAELDWTEAAAVCKKDGWYYLIGSGCTGWKPNTARCYRAKSITGPWERLGNPCKGVNPANGLGPDLTWGGQSNYILKKDDGEYLAMFDIWKPDNQIDSRLVWLPIDFNADGTISIEWKATALQTLSLGEGQKTYER